VAWADPDTEKRANHDQQIHPYLYHDRMKLDPNVLAKIARLRCRCATADGCAANGAPWLIRMPWRQLRVCGADTFTGSALFDGRRRRPEIDTEFAQPSDDDEIGVAADAGGRGVPKNMSGRLVLECTIAGMMPPAARAVSRPLVVSRNSAGLRSTWGQLGRSSRHWPNWGFSSDLAWRAKKLIVEGHCGLDAR
jgi:hypothetical protein